MEGDKVLIKERVEVKGCGCCHHCGEKLRSHHPRTGEKIDWCMKCQAERPYESHGYAGLFIETGPCPNPVNAS